MRLQEMRREEVKKMHGVEPRRRNGYAGNQGRIGRGGRHLRVLSW